MEYDSCPTIAPFLGYMGVAASVIFASTYFASHKGYPRCSARGVSGRMISLTVACLLASFLLVYEQMWVPQLVRQRQA
jgi:hypothetical protein